MAFLDELLAYTARRTEAALEGAPTGRLRGGRAHRHRRLQQRPRQAARQGRDRRRRRPVRPQRLGQAAARAGQLDLRPDLLELRVRPADADRPRHPRQRRLLRPRPGRGAGGHDPPRDPPAPGGRRLGDLDPDGRDALHRARAGLPGARAGGLEGDDLPRRLRRAQPARRRAVRVPRDGRRRPRRARHERRTRRGPGASPEHRERPGRGDRDQLPGADHALRADRGVRRAGPAPRRARPAPRLHVRGHGLVHDPCRPRQVGPARAVRRGSRAAGALHPEPRRRGAASWARRTRSSWRRATSSASQTTGGGGYGPAFERDPALVLQDVLHRRITAERAEREYGVALDAAARRVDEARTAELRAQGDAPDGLPPRGRHRRHVHRRDPHRRGDRRLAHQQGLLDAVGPERRLPPRHRPDPGRCRGQRRRTALRRPRHDRRHQRDHPAPHRAGPR